MTHTYTHRHAWTPAETAEMDSCWKCESVGISLILFLPFGESACSYTSVCVCVCVCEIIFRRWKELGSLLGSNKGKLTSKDCCHFSSLFSPLPIFLWFCLKCTTQFYLHTFFSKFLQMFQRWNRKKGLKGQINKIFRPCPHYTEFSFKTTFFLLFTLIHK